MVEGMASYALYQAAVDHARELIEGKQYVLDSDWGVVQPDAAAQNAYLERNGWDACAAWHLGLTEGATDKTKARYAFVFRRLPPRASNGPHRMRLPRVGMAAQGRRARGA
jgi:hypothetical protein